MDALGATKMDVDPANPVVQPDETKAKTESLEQLFRTRNPAAVQILSNIESKKIGHLHDYSTPDNPQKSESRLRVLQVALECIGLARNKIDSVVEESFGATAANLYRYKQAAHALNAAFNFLNCLQISDKKNAVVTNLIQFFWRLQSNPERDSYEDEENSQPRLPLDDALIALFKQIPPENQLKILVCGVNICTGFIYRAESQEFCAIFEAFRDAGEECEQIYELAWPFLDRYQRPGEFAQFLKAIFAIKNEREEILITAHIKNDCTIENKIRILRMLASMTKDHRDFMIETVKQRYAGYQDDPLGDRKADFIETMLLLPNERWATAQHSIINYTYLVPSITRKTLISFNFQSIAPDQLVQIIACCNSLCEYCKENLSDPKKPIDFLELFYVMIDIPSNKRDAYTRMAVRDVKEPTLRNRNHYLMTLMLFPLEQRDASRELVGRFVDNYNEDRRPAAIRFLQSQPENDRLDILRRSLSVCTPTDVLRPILERTAQIPFDEREEVFQCYWYIHEELDKIADTLEEIYSIPTGKRIETCRSLVGLPNKIVCLRFIKNILHEQRTTILKFAKSMKLQFPYSLAKREFIRIVESFPEGLRMKYLNLPFSLCSKLAIHTDLDKIFFLIVQQKPEHRINICSWFNQLPIPKVLEEIRWLDTWFQSHDFFSKTRSERVDKIQERYAEQCAVYYECDLTYPTLEDEKESIKFGVEVDFGEEVDLDL